MRGQGLQVPDGPERLPIPVNVSYETGDGQGTIRLDARAVSGDACAYPVLPDQANMLGWRPAPSYPRPGDPVPLDGHSLKGPAAGIDRGGHRPP